MLDGFSLTLNPARIVFGRGTVAQLPAELARLGGRRALVLSTPSQKNHADAIAARLGDAAAGRCHE